MNVWRRNWSPHEANCTTCLSQTERTPTREKILSWRINYNKDIYIYLSGKLVLKFFELIPDVKNFNKNKININRKKRPNDIQEIKYYVNYLIDGCIKHGNIYIHIKKENITKN